VDNLSNEAFVPSLLLLEFLDTMADSVCFTVFLNVLVVSASVLRDFRDCWLFALVCAAACWNCGRLVSRANVCHDCDADWSVAMNGCSVADACVIDIVVVVDDDIVVDLLGLNIELAYS